MGLQKTVAEAISSNLFKFRFPLSASDILSCDNSALAEYFFPDNQLFVDEVSYEEEEVEVEVDDDSPSESPEEKKEVSVPQEKTIIQENLETAVEPVEEEPVKDKPAEIVEEKTSE